MVQKKANKSIRDLVRDTFTPSRVGLLSWAFAAVFMGTVGLASYQFSYQQAAFQPAVRVAGGLPLPSAGDIDTTASVPTAGGSAMAIDVMHLPDRSARAPLPDIQQGQLEVLQEEIIGLRRRLSALSEQNISYSRRIAALEKEVAHAKLSGSAQGTAAGDRTAEPSPGIVITRAAPMPAPLPAPAPKASPKTTADTASSKQNERAAPVQLPPPAAVAEATPRADGQDPQRTAPPRLISLYRTTPDTTALPAEPVDPQEPVRIVDVTPATPPQVRLPESSTPPVSTGSIPTRAADTLPAEFDATPTPTTLRPKVISPSSPAGRLRGGGDRHLKRSDFGAIIGHYRTTAGAAKAWADFKTQNAERMRDLRPLLMQRQGPEGGIALMVGPFANAADAAVACLHLLDVTELCHPALFAGDPLVTAAEFRDNAF